MKNIKRVMRFFRIFVFGFMFAVCMVMGIAPVIPKRKEQFEIEIKMKENKKESNTEGTIILYKADT